MTVLAIRVWMLSCGSFWVRTTVGVDHKHKQWVSGDRCEPVEVVKDWYKFIYNLSVYVVKLTSHHDVSVHQSRAFKEYKENVAKGEVVVSGDFSENHTFVIQNDVKSYHWGAPQCTVHPFRAYGERTERSNIIATA